MQGAGPCDSALRAVMGMRRDSGGSILVRLAQGRRRRGRWWMILSQVGGTDNLSFRIQEQVCPVMARVGASWKKGLGAGL